MPRLPAIVSEITEPTKASVTATLSEAKKYGMARGRPTLSRTDRPRAERAQHVPELGLEGGQPGRDIDHDREERDQERGQHRRHRADAEPDHEDRHDRDLGDAVEADQQRVERRV